jgi:hypothetical protein
MHQLKSNYSKYILIILSLFTISIKAQHVDHIRVLILRSDSAVINYFDSLSLATGKKIQISKNVDNIGNLMIIAKPHIDDISFYGCSMIITKFTRRKGKEFCMSQFLSSDRYSILSNINYVKDNFNQITDSFWSDKKDNDKTYIGAKFEVTDKSGSCTLNYDFYVE